jgi:hypothetical protein
VARPRNNIGRAGGLVNELVVDAGGRTTAGVVPWRNGVRGISWSALRAIDVRPIGFAWRPLLLALLRDRHFLVVAGVHDHR